MRLLLAAAATTFLLGACDRGPGGGGTAEGPPKTEAVAAAGARALAASAAAAPAAAAPAGYGAPDYGYGGTFAPAGVRVGQPVAEAKAELAQAGFVRGADCRFTKGDEIITLAIGRHSEDMTRDARVETFGAGEEPLTDPVYRDYVARQRQKEGRTDPGMWGALQEKRAYSAYLKTCPENGYRVTEVDWRRDFSAGLPSGAKADVGAILASLDAEYGPHHGCSAQRPSDFRWCAWPAIDGYPIIDDVTVSARREGGLSQITVEADPKHLWPVLPRRAGALTDLAARAEQVCREPHNDLRPYAVFYDCRCVGREMARAYGTGTMDDERLRDMIAPHAGECAGDPAAMQAHFVQACRKLDAEQENWEPKGGCDCIARGALADYLEDPQPGRLAGLNGRMRAGAYADGCRTGA